MLISIETYITCDFPGGSKPLSPSRFAHYTLKQNFPIHFPFDISLLRKKDVTVTLPESETVDHSRKREEKTQNTDRHNTVKLEQTTQLESTATTPQYN